MRRSCATSSMWCTDRRLTRRPSWAVPRAIPCRSMKTRACDLFGIRHPIVLGGMGSGTSPALVTAVSNAGGLGIQGCAGRSPAEIAQLAQAIRDGTSQPFGLNLLLFLAADEQVQAVLDARPP